MSTSAPASVTMVRESSVAPTGADTLRRRVYRQLECARAGAVSPANLALLALIAANIVALVLESVPGLAAQAALFRAFEAVSIAVFTVEYVLRVWVAAEDPRYADGWRGRALYMRTPLAVIDLLAILPFYLPARLVDTRFLRVLRLFRLLRVAKLVRYSVALEILVAVVRDKRAELTLLVTVMGVVVLCSSSLIYFVENPAQPEVFSSIPAAAWWSVVTLTTIGYGDAVPVTSFGRGIAAAVGTMGIGLFALPAGMLGAAFTEALARRRAAAGACPHCGRSGDTAGHQ